MKQKFKNSVRICYNKINTMAMQKKGMKLQRHFTTPNKHPFDQIKWTKREVRILNPDGSVVFEAKDIEVPQFWSQLATDVLASKYCRKAGVPKTGSETSLKQVVYRIAHTLRIAGEQQNIFASQQDARIFEDELIYMLVNQIGAFNSPVWFNCGHHHVYKIKAEPIGNWYYNLRTKSIEKTYDGYSHPQLSACFIQSVKDDLMDIAELAKREMRVFKYGSGTGTNFSNLRAEGELLSGGGSSSGVMSFLEVFDKAAGATKSGGITRRAAKMVILDIDHPEIEKYIMWKAREEDKAQWLIQGGYSGDIDGEAYKTVSGQNSNNSVRVPDEFLKAVEQDGIWQTRYRTTNKVAKTYKARELFDKIAYAAWRCADPGLQFATTINRFNTCKNSGEIRATNPCAEFVFLDNTACNLASLNLTKFLESDGKFNIGKFCHAIKIFIIAQEIIVDFASYPTKEITQNSHDFRPLGLGYANLGALLMRMGLPYDSDEARGVASAISAIMTAYAYITSSKIAALKGPFPKFKLNRESMLNVIKLHKKYANELDNKSYLARTAKQYWDEALKLGQKYGYRNAQTTCIAPTGTIGLLMDCDTTGIEPDFALVKVKKLVGGGYFKIINNAVADTLSYLGYSKRQVDEIIKYICGTNSLKDAPNINHQTLKQKGFDSDTIKKVEETLPRVFHIKQAFSKNVMGEGKLKSLNFAPQQYEDPNFDLLSSLGFSEKQIEEASVHACGRMTIEGAPHLKTEHLPIFDCASKCGPYGRRFIHWMGHVRMLSAVQPLISGGISKTVNMPNEVSVEDIKDTYLKAWKMGLKVIAIYRDGCKATQPLTVAKEKKLVVDFKKQLKLFELQYTPRRRKLPKERKGITIEAKVAGHKVYLRTGEYEDGTLGEIFIDMHKEGASFRSLLSCFAIAVSFGLQYGVPLEEFVDTFTFTRFEPHGVVDHEQVKVCTSVIDYIFRVLGIKYLGRTDLAHATIGPKTSPLQPKPEVSIKHAPASFLDNFISHISPDSPVCNVCGHLMERSGTCYRCINCGSQLGCG